MKQSVKLGVPYGELFTNIFLSLIIYLSLIFTIYYRDLAILTMAILPSIILFLFFIIEEFVNPEHISKLEICNGEMIIYKKHHCKEKIYSKYKLEEINDIKLNVIYQKSEYNYEIVVNEQCIIKENIWTFGCKRFVPDEYKVYPLLKKLPQFTCNLYGDRIKSIEKFQKFMHTTKN